MFSEIFVLAKSYDGIVSQVAIPLVGKLYRIINPVTLETITETQMRGETLNRVRGWMPARLIWSVKVEDGEAHP